MVSLRHLSAWIKTPVYRSCVGGTAHRLAHKQSWQEWCVSGIVAPFCSLLGSKPHHIEPGVGANAGGGRQRRYVFWGQRDGPSPLRRGWWRKHLLRWIRPIKTLGCHRPGTLATSGQLRLLKNKTKHFSATAFQKHTTGTPNTPPIFHTLTLWSSLDYNLIIAFPMYNVYTSSLHMISHIVKPCLTATCLRAYVC